MIQRWVMGPGGAQRARDELACAAATVFTTDEPTLRASEAGRDPWVYVERLLGERPRMVERQPIKAVEGGKSFASTSRHTPLHTDSQLYDGAPPDLQVMACVAADAAGGGESAILDTWSLLARLEREEPKLLEALFTVPRRQVFVFGDVAGPTVALRGGALAFTHSPLPPEADDGVGQRLTGWLGRVVPERVAVRAGETLLVDNRRALHGRTAFEDTRREFVRLLVWLREPLARQPIYEERARRQQEQAKLPAGLRAEARRRLGVAGAPLPEAEAKLALVMAMLRGAAPGVLAARYKVPEPALYAWRDAAVRAALEALGQLDPAADEVALSEALARLRGASSRLQRMRKRRAPPASAAEGVVRGTHLAWRGERMATERAVRDGGGGGCGVGAWLTAKARRRAGALLLGAAAALAPAAARAQEGPLVMDWEKPTRCLQDGKGEMWRVQCDAASKICVYAPDAELDSEGNRLRPLERMPDCAETGAFDQERLKSEGYKLEQGLPPTPYGWYRDRYGKVIQYNFDLHKRIFLGGGWAPEARDGKLNSRRTMIEFGLLEWQYFDKSDRNPVRHRLRLVEGEVRLAPFWATGFLVRYDLSVRRRDPLLRISTFFGEPRRYDVRSRIGLFFEGGGLEVRDTPQGNATLWKYATANLTLDLLQSNDLYSYLRIRGGGLVDHVAYEDKTLTDRTALTPNAAVDLDLTLDSNGFHHIVGNASFERPFYAERLRGQTSSAMRAKAELGYEVIALALNDQPISLRLATSAAKRNDIIGFTDGMVYTAMAGLRFSLWAPARSR